MKILLTTLVLLLSSTSLAKDKLWVSNKLTVGYNKMFISNQVRFGYNKFIGNSLAMGLIFKVSDTTNFKTFYQLENMQKNNWDADHFLGAQLKFKLQ